MRQEQVLAYLIHHCKGRKNIRKSREIQRALRISGNELRKHIHRLRCGQHPIASSSDGYFYAETAGEIYAAIRQLENMEQGIRAAIAGLVASLDTFSTEGR